MYCHALRCIAMYCHLSPCITMCCHVSPCIAMYCLVSLCITMCCHVLPCITMYCDVLPCIAMCCHVSQCISIFGHVSPCIAMYYHVLLFIAMYYHVLPCLAMYSHVLPCITMYTHVLPFITMYHHLERKSRCSWLRVGVKCDSVCRCTKCGNGKDCPNKRCSNTTPSKRKRTNPQTYKRMRGADYLAKQGFTVSKWSLDKAREHLSFSGGRYKSRTGSTRTASPGRINSDRLGPTRIE